MMAIYTPTTTTTSIFGSSSEASFTSGDYIISTVPVPMLLCSYNGYECDDDGDAIMGDAELESLIYKMGQMSVFDDDMDIEDDDDMDIEHDPMDDLVHMMGQLTVKEDPMDSLIKLMGGLSIDDDSMDIEDDDDDDDDSMDIEEDPMDSIIKLMGELSIH